MQIHLAWNMKRTEDNIFAFPVDVKANEHHTQQAVKKFNGIDMDKIITPQIRPEREEKAYVCLIPDYVALDITNKVQVMKTESRLLILNINIFIIKQEMQLIVS